MTPELPRSPTWVFGYGSLIWRPDFAHREAQRATIRGFSRRFWQGSHDHRGMPERPGRVVTLIRDSGAECAGMAYLIDAAVAHATFELLDHREKNGYERVRTLIQLADGRTVPGTLYMAPTHNFAYLGDAPLDEIAHQIAHSSGPSGHNADYLRDLARALRALRADDPHVFELESLVEQILPGDA